MLKIDPLQEFKDRFKPDAIISIPLPNRNLTAQQGVHRMVKRDATCAYRQQVETIVRAKRLPQFKGKVRIHHVWFCGLSNIEKAYRQNKVEIPKKVGLYRPDDEGNATASLKAAIDGLVDAGLLRGDTRHDLTWGDYEKLSTAKQHGGRCEIILFLKELHP